MLFPFFRLNFVLMKASCCQNLSNNEPQNQIIKRLHAARFSDHINLLSSVPIEPRPPQPDDGEQKRSSTCDSFFCFKKSECVSGGRDRGRVISWARPSSSPTGIPHDKPPARSQREKGSL